MAEPFNVYHRWLGIASEELPPNHYRLLGVPPFESDPTVIEHAADQRMAHLRTLQTGQHSAASQKLLNEIATARVCLLNPEKKAAYDATLRAQLAANSARAEPAQPVPSPVSPHASAGQPDSPTATAEWTPLGELGEYKLIEKLGEGGMGAVFKALHTKLGRLVALKVIRRDRTWDQRAIARFEREMKAVGSLDHPNIVRAFDAREVEGTRLLAMEFIEGLDLAVLARRGRTMRIADACEIVRQAAVGLQCAHQHGLVHRDIKPSNLMLNRQGQVKLLDLGLARFEFTRTGEEVTGTDQAIGTIEYMAPEQLSDSRSVDIRADIYSLGCTFYALLIGHAPFGGPEYPGTTERLMALASRPAPNIQKLRRDVTKELARIVARMLAKEPAKRFSTPGEVADALGPFCAGADLPRLLAVAEGKPVPAEAQQAMQPTPAVVSSGFTRFLQRTGIRRAKGALPARTASKGRRFQLATFVGVGAVSAALLALLLWATRGPAPKPVEDRPQTASPAARQSYLVLDWPTADRPGTKLQIDGRPPKRILVTKDAPEQVRVALEPGEHTVRISRPDFEPFEQSVSIVAEQNATVKPQWKKPVQPTEPKPAEQPTTVATSAEVPKAEPPAEPSEPPAPDSDTAEAEPAEAAEPEQLLSVPGDAEQEAAMQLARDLYRDEYAQAKTTADKQGMAKKILARAEETANDPAGAFALFRLARDVALQAVDGKQAFEAIEAMAQRYEVDALAMKSDVLEGFAKKARTPAEHASLAEQSLGVIDDAVTGEKFPQAEELGKLALAEALKARQKELIASVRGRVQEIQQAAKAYANYEAAKTTLTDKPDDPDANQTAGEYLCFLKCDWETGLPLLAKGSDADLKALAGQEVSSPPAEAPEQLKLADAWWDLGQTAKGEKKDAILLHAGTWYEQAQSKLSGLVKAKVDKRLMEIAQIERSAAMAGSASRQSSLPRLVFGKWFSLLTSPNELVGWDVSKAPNFSYSDRTIQLNGNPSATIEYPIAVKDVGIRVKAKKIHGEDNMMLTLRASNKGCYIARFWDKARNFTIEKMGYGGKDWVRLGNSAAQHIGDDFMDVGFSAVGNQFTVFFDGKPVAQGFDLADAAGAVSINLTYGACLFKDVELLIPSKTSLLADNRKPPAGKAESRPAARRLPSGKPPPPAVAPFHETQAKEHQKHWARYLKVPVEQTNSIGMKLVLIPPGEFQMGSTKDVIDEALRRAASLPAVRELVLTEGPRHRVRITKPYWLGATEVTREAFERVMGTSPSPVKAPTRPVESVTWDAAVEFCRRLSELPGEKAAGRRYGLPTEAQWEYACRAGSTGKFCYGDAEGSLEGSLGEYAWFGGNAGGEAHPVGEKKPNAWGLYDVHGNMKEWCADWWAVDYYGRSPLKDPTGPPSGSERVLRSGSWACGSVFGNAAANRNNLPPTNNYSDNGFRVVCECARAAGGKSPVGKAESRQAVRRVPSGRDLLPEVKPQPQSAAQPPAEEPARPDTEQQKTAQIDEAEARYAEAIKAADARLAAWDFRGAAEDLARIHLADPEYSARLASRRAAVERLAVLKERIIEKINAANPPLQKSALMFRGLGGELVRADQQAIQSKLANGKNETHLWHELNAKVWQRLFQLAVDRANADDWIATGVLALYWEDQSFAERCFAQARSLGVKTDAYVAPLAAAAFSRAKRLINDNEFTKAEAGLASLEAKYGDTAWFQANRQTVEAVRKQAGAGRAETEGEKLYAEAVELFQRRQLFDLRPVVEKIKTSCAGARVVTDAQRKPSVAEMDKAVSSLGKFITVRQDGKGNFKTIQAAIAAAPSESMIEIQDNGPYYETVTIGGDLTGLTIRGAKRCWPVVASGGPIGPVQRLFVVEAGSVTLERLAIALTAGHDPDNGPGPYCLLLKGSNCRLRSVVLGTAVEPPTNINIGRNCEIENCFLGPVSNDRSINTPVVMKNTVSLIEGLQLVGWPGRSRLENVVTATLEADATTELQRCTVSGVLMLKRPDSAVRDSIFKSITCTQPGTSIEFCHCIWNKYDDQAKPGKNCSGGDPLFADPKNFDFRLLPRSPCRKKASDGGDLGVRYTPEMLEVIQVAFELRRRGVIKW